jgi:hypothetical protein
MMNTGDFLLDAKGSGEEVRETPTKPQGHRKSRMGRSSLNPRQLGTPGRGLMAKASSL